ncbi:NADH-quinone oxidoreductase subunit L, partial [Streptomyces sp. TRM76130]|nr:NADH-quinone oxidoreductase subunit L [Streptomyces sp. TRM76130]
SKDRIIEAAFAEGGAEGWVLGACALLGAAVTAYYMTRVMLMTFFGAERWRDAPTPSPAAPDVEPAAETRGAYTPPRPHESPKAMTVPMIVL